LEDAFEIEVEDAVPGGGGVRVVGFAPVAAAVVDEDVEFCCVRVDLCMGDAGLEYFRRAA
jgi:hypothetical protein